VVLSISEGIWRIDVQLIAAQSAMKSEIEVFAGTDFPFED